MILPIDIVMPTMQLPPYSVWDVDGLFPTVVGPTEIEGNANVRRNFGARQGEQTYLFFCDDDIILMPGILMKMLGTLLANPSKAYCYCDFIVWNHPCPPHNWVHRAADFNAERLRAENYISTMSLMRRDAFEAVRSGNDLGGFSEEIERLQDWELWIKMLKVGLTGIYLPEIGFTATYSGNGITKKDGYKEAADIVRRKHGL